MVIILYYLTLILILFVYIKMLLYDEHDQILEYTTSGDI